MKIPFALILFFAAPISYAETCRYSIESKPVLEWTAFKFTEKTAVRGKFDRANFAFAESADSMSSLLASAAFSIDGASVSTGDAGRNYNIATNFFAKLKGTSFLKGVVTPGEKDELEVTLWANGSEKRIPMKWELKETGEWTATGKFDILKLGWKTAFDSLHTSCKDLHKGKDGASKTWTDIELKVSAQVKKSCS